MDVSRNEASRYLGHEKKRSSIGNGRQKDGFNVAANTGLFANDFSWCLHIALHSRALVAGFGFGYTLGF